MKKLKNFKGLLFVFPSLLGVLIFYILPFFQSFMYCFTTGMSQKHFVGLANFKALFENPNYHLALYNTLFITGIALPLLCVSSLMVALIIEKQIKRLKWLQGVLLIPMALPAASLMLVWQDLFAEKGIINAILGSKVNWLESAYAPWVIIFMIIWKNIGYNTLLIISSLLMMPKEYEEAAHIDGGGFFKVALYVKIPYLLPMLFFSVVISIANCFKIFREVYLLQGSYPQNNLYLLQHFMNNQFSKLNYDMLTTAAFTLYMVLFVIIFVLTKWQQRYIQESV